MSRPRISERQLKSGQGLSALVMAIRVLLTVICADVTMFPRAAADEASAVWDVHAGDRFLVSVVIVKQTVVTPDDQPPIKSQTTDRLRIEYRVVDVSAAGDAVVVARLQRPDRETEKSSPESLKSVATAAATLEDLLVVLHLDSEGIVKQVRPADKDSILAHLSNHEPLAERLLQQACPDEVIGSWFGRPFWIACRRDAAEQGHTWHREDDIAVGAFGRLRNSNEIRITGITGNRAMLEVSGTGRFVPLVIPEADSQFRSSLMKDVTAELEGASGKAQMFLDPTDGEDTQPIRKRPQFESIELTIRLRGRGIFPAKQSGASQQVTFQQTQIQSWNLVESEFGRPEFLFAVPVPADPK